MRKAKIIATIGPASEDPAVFRSMCLQGLNVARLNFSHGTHAEHQKKIDMIKAVRQELDLPIAIMLDTKAIIVTSISGLTVRMVSRFRPPITILGLATTHEAWYKLALSWGVLPVLTEQFPSMEVLNFYALRAARDVLALSAGDTVVMTGGNTSGQSGNTNVIRIETIA